MNEPKCFNHASMLCSLAPILEFADGLHNPSQLVFGHKGQNVTLHANATVNWNTAWYRQKANGELEMICLGGSETEGFCPRRHQYFMGTADSDGPGKKRAFLIIYNASVMDSGRYITALHAIKAEEFSGSSYVNLVIHSRLCLVFYLMLT